MGREARMRRSNDRLRGSEELCDCKMCGNGGVVVVVAVAIARNILTSSPDGHSDWRGCVSRSYPCTSARVIKLLLVLALALIIVAAALPLQHGVLH